MRTVTRKQAEEAVRDHLHGLIGTEPFLVSSGYPAHFDDWRDGVFEGLPFDLIERDFRSGSGGELSSPIPKLSAAYSSSALCVNAFGPARANHGWLEFEGYTGFTDFAFEGKLPTGLRGEPTNLDFVASSPTGFWRSRASSLKLWSRRSLNSPRSTRLPFRTAVAPSSMRPSPPSGLDRRRSPTSTWPSS